VPRYRYTVGVPAAGFYREVINTDSPVYGGSGVGNLGGLDAMPGSAHGYDQFLPLTVPPLGAVVLAPVRVPTSDRG
jgi:1,4-alpha-glucan branching enzyme